jgi:hypothetical protein
MLTVINDELLIDGALPVFHTPAPAPTPHLNCTMFPATKLPPLIVSTCGCPSAVIAKGAIELTVGAAAPPPLGVWK